MTRSKRQSEAISNPSSDPFTVQYANIASWVQDGWIEIGRDDCRHSFVRALDSGGMVWEGKAQYPSLHEALLALDAGIAAWRKRY